MTPTPETARAAVETITLRCLCCGKQHVFDIRSNEAAGVFNVFCPGGECEDRYAARL